MSTYIFFSFVLHFQWFANGVLGWRFLWVYHFLGFNQLLESVGVFFFSFNILGEFSDIISSTISSALHFILSCHCNNMNVRSFVIFPTVPKAVFLFFFNLFSLLFRLGNLYWSILKIIGSFLHDLCYMSSSSEYFYLDIVFSFINFRLILSFIFSIPLLRFSSFPFVSRVHNCF